MFDLSTCWLGQQLPHPFIPGASPLADDVDAVKRLQDAGAPLLTLRSLIATPLGIERESQWLDLGASGSPARSVVAGVQHVPDYATDPDAYCQHVATLREVTGLPVVGSLYARQPDQWVSLAEQIEQAGAAAVELNIYGLFVEHRCQGPAVQRAIERVLVAVRSRVSLPIGIKLLPVMPDFELFARRLSEAGADGLIFFNGFQRGDFQVDRIKDPVLQAASSPFDRHARYRWLARVSGRVHSRLAMSGGVRDAVQAARAILCGADVVQLVGALILNGPEELAAMLSDLRAWAASTGYESLEEMRGSVSQMRFGDFEQFDAAYTRHILQSAG